MNIQIEDVAISFMRFANETSIDKVDLTLSMIDLLTEAQVKELAKRLEIRNGEAISAEAV